VSILRRIGAVVLVAVVPLMSTPDAHAAPSGAVGTGVTVMDPVFPNLGNSGYDVTTYDLDFRYLTDSRTVEADATVTARAVETLDVITLDSVGADVHGVEVDGSTAGFVQRDEKLVVTPVRSVPEGESF